MKSRTIRAAAALAVVLAVLLAMLACGPGPENTSQNQNQYQGQNPVKTDSSAATTAVKPCDLTNLQQKISEVETEILDEMTSNLKEQHKGNVAKKWPPRFKYKVEKSLDGNYLVAYFEQGVSGADGLKDMADALNNFKDECLLKVYFVPKGTSSLTRRVDAFEWTACEWPMVACPSGICHLEPCPGPGATPPPVGNGNANANANSNTNSNSNRGASN